MRDIVLKALEEARQAAQQALAERQERQRREAQEAKIEEARKANVIGSSLQAAVELPLNIRNVFGLVGLDSSVNNSQQNQALNPPGSQGNVDQDIAFFNFGGGRFGQSNSAVYFSGAVSRKSNDVTFLSFAV